MWEVLRCTNVQMNPRLLNTTNWWWCVIEYWINQIMSCIPRNFCLCKKFRQVKLSWNPPNPDNAWRLSLPNPVVTDGITLLVQGWCRYTLILDNWHVIKNTSAGPSTGIPKHLFLYLRASIISVEILRATNSDPKLESSTMLWRLLYQMIGELLTYMMMPD